MRSSRTVAPTFAQRPAFQIARAFSSEGGSGDKKTNTESEEDRNELVLTPGQKVVAAGRLTMWTGIAVFAGFCAFYIIRELMPT